ncbi:MAG: hypothetical protein KBI32_13220 [Phycisphaerae bacterium]|nr:hypothetical protein [Phycisphaerae bacterium]
MEKDFLKEKMMKKTGIALTIALALGTALRAENADPGGYAPVNLIGVTNTITTGQSQNVDASATGGNSDSTSNANANVNISTTSVSDFENRTAPLTSLPPYLPYWNHGGWGTVKAYFPNGPTMNDQIYETTFDPQNPEDMRELRSVLKALPHKGLLEVFGGMLNSVSAFVLGTPDRYHHGRGLEIANSVTRDRRPEGKPLLVFIDSNVDMALLREEGYAYVGKVNVEGDPDRNWDQAYKAAVTEALLWDVDILLVSGGMKGVTVGSNVTFPSAAAGYSQVNYSLSLMGSKATGITEGKGKAILSADAYRFYPTMLERRRIPASLYDRIRARPRSYPAMTEPDDTRLPGEPTGSLILPEVPDAPVPQESVDPQAAAPAVEPEPVAPVRQSREPAVASVPRAEPIRRVAPRMAPPLVEQRVPGVNVSRQVYEMAGFARDQHVGSAGIR